MNTLIGALCAVMVLSLVACLFVLLAALRQMQASWTDERRELINRVQFPQRVPIAAVPPRHSERPAMSAEAAKNYGKIGVAQPYQPDPEDNA